jgi:hypothetical protein
MDILNYYFIRLGLTRAKTLQTARRFPRETHCRLAVPKSNALTLEPGGIPLYNWNIRIEKRWPAEFWRKEKADNRFLSTVVRFV